jgi:ribosomal-protein-alanine N-acetyltransferase
MIQLSYPRPDLSADALRLRRWSLDDLACIREASSDPRIPEGTTVPAEYSDSAGRAFIERQWSRLDNGEGISFAIESTLEARAVGLVVLMLRPQVDVAGLGYWLIPSARRCGYATCAVRLLSDWALEIGIKRLEAWVEPENEASRRVLETVGFELEGRLRSFLAFPTRRADALVLSRVGTA